MKPWCWEASVPTLSSTLAISHMGTTESLKHSKRILEDFLLYLVLINLNIHTFSSGYPS